jgi:two-component system CheB/CheR fusion protein
VNAINKENGAYCRINIKDNGIGFDQQYSNKIFTIFQRLHSRDKYEGTGIGLAITKKIIEKHNGLIYTNSIEGLGTTFTIILPVLQHRSENGHPAAGQLTMQQAT